MSYVMRNARPVLVPEDAVILLVELTTGRVIESGDTTEVSLVQGWWDVVSQVGVEEPHVRVSVEDERGSYCELIPIGVVVAIRWDEQVV